MADRRGPRRAVAIALGVGLGLGLLGVPAWLGLDRLTVALAPVITAPPGAAAAAGDTPTTSAVSTLIPTLTLTALPTGVVPLPSPTATLTALTPAAPPTATPTTTPASTGTQGAGTGATPSASPTGTATSATTAVNGTASSQEGTPAPAASAPPPAVTATPSPTACQPPLAFQAQWSVLRGTLRLSVQTAPLAQVAVALHMVAPRVAATLPGTSGKTGKTGTLTASSGTGAGGAHPAQAVVPAGARLGTADALGRFSGSVPIAFRPGTPAQASFTVTARQACGTSAQSGLVTLQPLRRLVPPPGPRLLGTVPPDAFPIHHGFGDARFGVVEAYELPGRADALHVGWERVQVRWDQLQPRGPLQWDFNATEGPPPFNHPDAPFDYEIAHGRHLVATLQGVPAWAAQNPTDGQAAVPRNIDLPWSDPRNYWGQFVYRAVRHYAGRIDTFVILNEVNIKAGSYYQFAGTAEQYAQLLRVAYLAAHAANAHVEVHIYGDSVYADYGAWFGRTLDALARFPDAHANNDFFDAAEVHLYASVMRWDTLIASWHALMRAHGFDKPIWMSETNVAPRDDYVAPAFPANHNTPLKLQPYFIVDSFAAALGLGMPREEVYRMLDPKHIYPEHPAGLVRRDGSIRPEYYAFKTVNTWFAGVFATRYGPCASNFVTKSCLFRVTMERPGQEIQVLWNQGGVALDAQVPAVARTATVVRPDGSTFSVQARGGTFTLHLAGATDRAVLPTTHRADAVIRSLKDLRFTDSIKIGSMPLIVVQALPPGRHVPGLQPLPVEQDRSALAGPALGPVSSLALAPDGSGTRALADTDHDRVLVTDAHGHVTAQIGGTGGAPGQFRGPAGVAIGPDGTLYVADQGNARIEEFDLSGHLLGGFGRYEAGVASLKAPQALAVAPDGTLYVVDAAQDAVLHFSRLGAFLGRFGAPGYGSGQLDGPGGLAVDGHGNVYVADTLNNRVEEFDPLGHLLAQIGTGAAGADSGSLHWPTGVAVLPGGGLAVTDADNARVVVVAHPQTYLGGLKLTVVAQPGGVAIAPDGTYYVSDAALNRIVHLDALGHPVGAFGSKGFGRGQFFAPLGLAFGPDGTLYVADSGNNRIEVLTPGGQFVRLLGSQGSAPGQFLGPRAVSVAPDGTLWVADTDNARIEHLSSTGRMLGLIAGVNGPWGVAADGQGGVYYTARWGQRLYHWHPSSVQQVWGGPGSGSGEFAHPGALARSADGAVYAVDEGNARVQVLSGERIAGQRGVAGTGGWGLRDPVAVAVGQDGAIAVLDAAERRLVRYQGSAGTAFAALPVPLRAAPLSLVADAGGALDVTACDRWSGTTTQQIIMSDPTGQARL